MDNYPIKSVTFGGFDKQDVIQYIEQMSAAQKTLQEETCWHIQSASLLELRIL